MMHRTKRAHRGPFFNGDVSSQSRGVGEDYIISDHAIVRDMDVRHYQSSISDSSQTAALYRPAIDCHEFADYIVIADFEAGWFSRVGNILRSQSDGRERKKRIIAPNSRRAFDRDVRLQRAAFAELNVRANDAIWADVARRMDGGFGVDNRRRMSVH